MKGVVVWDEQPLRLEETELRDEQTQLSWYTVVGNSILDMRRKACTKDKCFRVWMESINVFNCQSDYCTIVTGTRSHLHMQYHGPFFFEGATLEQIQDIVIDCKRNGFNKKLLRLKMVM